MAVVQHDCRRPLRQRHVAERLSQHDEQRCVVCVAVPGLGNGKVSELRDNACFGCSARGFEDCLGFGNGVMFRFMRSLTAVGAETLGLEMAKVD